MHLFRRKKMIWALAITGWGGHQTGLHLNNGWEPFAVTFADGNYTIWFRKLVEA